jgi:quercetin dioxygenase-like cupin family protein
MHVTDTVDYCVLLEGELLMELDDGVTTVVRQHDVVVQNGTRHGWRNRSSQPATMLFVMFGATR